MQTYISMLRGINVSGQKTIRMAELKEMYESLKFSNVSTYVQSGNVIFDCGEKDTSKVIGMIEAAIQKTFGYTVSVFIRTPDEFRRIIEGNPFLNPRNEDLARLYVTFLYNMPSKAALSALSTPAGEADEFFIFGREIYLFCTHGYGRTKFSNTFFERKLGVPATTRNWKTVNALHGIANRD